VPALTAGAATSSAVNDSTCPLIAAPPPSSEMPTRPAAVIVLSVELIRSTPSTNNFLAASRTCNFSVYVCPTVSVWPNEPSSVNVPATFFHNAHRALPNSYHAR
jgi:hypothetical protein